MGGESGTGRTEEDVRDSGPLRRCRYGDASAQEELYDRHVEQAFRQPYISSATRPRPGSCP